MDSALNVAVNGSNEYRWEQSFDGVVVYVDLPAGLRKADVTVNFSPRELSIRLGKDAELKGKLCKNVDTTESTWLIGDGKLEVHLTKAIKGEVWTYIFEGDRCLDELNAEGDKKRLLLERFQNEHPGFDFSGAEFNGMVPEPRTFMKDI
ncbi:nuclear movement domain containing protein, putative [Babesia bigemina]|uniref:Nuclear movement domain containing protein, putative n=1 Tax=Babesia bigemina TaxID=5866 RepID=A0A061D4H9_BABBI|nr:nuclear movement domain containing protein, putative [Babesia bigemina]CDR95483.1 nuclear movement domain containing protein, putative [Babesia bigemina]|eukprot:XP_012767669.1 nuclear movement domain containing protein, putative [Babesia bigemina]